MSYEFKLTGVHSEMLETLAKERGLKPSELIERVVVGYLYSDALNLINSSEAEKTHYGKPADLSGIKNLYRWDEKTAAVVFTPTDERYFLLNARSWREVERAVRTKFPKRAAPLLLAMGAAYGRAAALDYGAVTEDKGKLRSYFVHLVLIAGWGKFSLSGDLDEGSKVIVRVSDCVFCARREADANSNTPCCFITGACKGIADVAFDSPHKAQETKCRTKGDDFCEITVTL